MSHLIEHIHDPVALLRECHRVLRPQAQCKTTARAAEILLESRYLQRTGNVESVRRHALSTRLWIEAMGLIEWLGSQVEPHAGEETILIATN